MRLHLLPAVVFSALLLNSPAQDAARAREEIDVGGQKVRLPAPAGFERIDGLNPEADRLVESMLGTSNRYLARFDPLKTNTADAGRSFNAQVLRALETREIGERTFAEMKQQTKMEIDKARETIRQEIEKQLGNAQKKMQDVAGADAALSVSDVAVLGYFDDSPNSLGFTMAMNVAAKAGNNSEKLKAVVASMIVPANGRLIYLYANADFKSPEDRQWAEKTVSAWRDAVLAANPRVAGPPASRSIFDGIGRSMVIGAVAGVCATLLMMLLKKMKKS